MRSVHKSTTWTGQTHMFEGQKAGSILERLTSNTQGWFTLPAAICVQTHAPCSENYQADHLDLDQYELACHVIFIGPSAACYHDHKTSVAFMKIDSRCAYNNCVEGSHDKQSRHTATLKMGLIDWCALYMLCHRPHFRPECALGQTIHLSSLE